MKCLTSSLSRKLELHLICLVFLRISFSWKEKLPCENLLSVTVYDNDEMTLLTLNTVRSKEQSWTTNSRPKKVIKIQKIHKLKNLPDLHLKHKVKKPQVHYGNALL